MLEPFCTAQAPPRADLVAAGRALDAYRSASGGRDRAACARRFGLHEPSVRDALDARDNFILVLERAGLLERPIHMAAKCHPCFLPRFPHYRKPDG